jgi:hypothetical protein
MTRSNSDELSVASHDDHGLYSLRSLIFYINFNHLYYLKYKKIKYNMIYCVMFFNIYYVNSHVNKLFGK